MNLKNWLLGATVAVAFGAFGTAAHSAPLTSALVDQAVQRNSAAHDVAWVRRSYWHRGHRHCRRVWRDYGYYDPYYSYDPYYYGYPYAYGPSFGFFFGGGRHHHHGHHHFRGRGHHGHFHHGGRGRGRR